jgi:hypothetical protein
VVEKFIEMEAVEQALADFLRQGFVHRLLMVQVNRFTQGVDDNSTIFAFIQVLFNLLTQIRAQFTIHKIGDG